MFFARSSAALLAAAAGFVVGAINMAVAAAAPAGFPDLNAFSPIDPGTYIAGNPRSKTVGFVTPDGVACTWGFYTDPGAHDGADCSGNVPGVPDSATDAGNQGCAQVRVAGYPGSRSGPYVLAKHGGACAPFDSSIASLNLGEKLSATNITCVVGTGDLTACVDTITNHGFVLQPSGSFGF